MKKITESQLKDKVNSLREYLKVYEDENEIPFDPTWGGTKAPADTRKWYQKLNPFGDGPPQAANKNATWNNKLQAAVSNQPKAPPNLADMDIGFGPGKFAPDDANQAASVTPAAPSTQDVTAAASASGEAVGKSLQRFKELLAKAKGAAPSALPAGMTQAQVDQAQNRSEPAAPAAPSPYALSANGARLNANEGTSYFLNKLRLIESRQLNETLTDAEKKELDTLAQSFGDSEDPEIAGLLQQYSDVKNSAMAAPAGPAGQHAAVTPAANQAAAVTPAGPINRDSMTFGQAFADARKKGEKQFNWRGKPYAVKMAPPKPKDPTAKTKAALPNNMSYDQYQQAMNRGEEEEAPPAPPAPPAPNSGSSYTGPIGNATNNPAGAPLKPAAVSAKVPAKAPAKVTAESVGYNELQRIVSLVNHR